MGKILEFYKGDIPNQEGLYYNDIMHFNNDELEKNHSYIQWLFPLIEPSLAVPNSPTIDDDDIAFFSNTWSSTEELREKISLREKVLDATNKMLHFYGIELALVQSEDRDVRTVNLRKSENFDKRASVWLTQRNHNFLRLTRILTSLQLLGLRGTAEMIHGCLEEIYEEYKGTIGPITKQFWDEAMEIKND